MDLGQLPEIRQRLVDLIEQLGDLVAAMDSLISDQVDDGDHRVGGTD